MATKRTATKTARRDLDVQLLPGERVEIDDAPVVRAVQTDDEIVQRYAAGETRIVTEHARYPLQAIPGLLKDTTRYKLDPSYQRRRRWSEEKSSRLIESFIMNIPVPPVFLYEYDLARYEVMRRFRSRTRLSPSSTPRRPRFGWDSGPICMRRMDGCGGS